MLQLLQLLQELIPLNGKEELFIKFLPTDLPNLKEMRMMELVLIFQTIVEELGKELKTIWIIFQEWDSMQFGFHHMLIILEMDIMDTGLQTGKRQILILDPIKILKILFQLHMQKVFM